MPTRFSLPHYALLSVLAVFLHACAAVEEAPETLQLSPAGYSALPGWQSAELQPSITALSASCQKLASKPAEASFTLAGRTFTYQRLHTICADLTASPPVSNTAARQFFETHFLPYSAASNRGDNAFYTGYYEIALDASRHPSSVYKWPIYAVPTDMVEVKLRDFSDTLPDQTLTGIKDGKRIVPLPTHAAIREGALQGKAPILAWAKDWVDLYFLHIQGSGILLFPDGSSSRIGYAGKNGHAYTSIGKVLINNGTITREDMTAPVLMEWLKAHPEEGQALIEHNASYVFFRETGHTPAVGAQGVSLTGGYSIAVDDDYHTYGLPIWVDTVLPPKAGESPLTLQRLFIAQDTGGAIRGPVRADLFFGHGAEAAYYAGHMKTPGAMWVLLPR